jgi:hypothetical protein
LSPRLGLAVLDGVCAPIDRRLNATCAGGMNGNLQVLAVSFFDDCRHFRHGHVVLDGNLDEVDVIEDVVFHCLPRSVGAVYLKKFLLQDRLGKRRIEILNIPVLTLLRELTAGR